MFILKDNENVDLSVTITDKKGNPATVQNGIWSTSDSTVVSLVGDGTGLTTTASAVGPLGNATVTFQGDADMGEGVQLVHAVLDIGVVAGNAAIFNIGTGTPVAQADPTPPPAPVPDPVPPTPPQPLTTN